MSENQIIQNVLKGNTNQFNQLVIQYQDMVFKTCMGFVHNADDANDLAQETFISAYQNLSKFNQQSAFSTWLYRIAVNASLNALRAQKQSIFQRIDNWFGKGESPEFILPADVWSSPEGTLISAEQEALVIHEIDKLSEKQKVAFVMSRCENLPQKEIAALMEISEGAVESLVQRAKANLIKNLSNYFKKN
jgi:RNA polymerase sigma-70 factor (ECF subfamily)